ncbi:MAG: hypothetical protein ACRD0D_07770, partial [Acidimicrobiales bacterium]
TLEFALVLPVVLALVGMVILTGLRAVYSGLAEHQARELAREVTIRSGLSTRSPYPDEVDLAGLCAGAAMPLPGAALAPGGCSVVNLSAASSGIGGGDVVTVSLTYQIPALQALDGFLPGVSVNGLSVVRASASMSRE